MDVTRSVEHLRAYGKSAKMLSRAIRNFDITPATTLREQKALSIARFGSRQCSSACVDDHQIEFLMKGRILCYALENEYARSNGALSRDSIRLHTPRLRNRVT